MEQLTRGEKIAKLMKLRTRNLLFSVKAILDILMAIIMVAVIAFNVINIYISITIIALLVFDYCWSVREKTATRKKIRELKGKVIRREV